MKQTKQHRFTHLDPEKLGADKIIKNIAVGSKPLDAKHSTVKNDLKRVLLNILLFATLLALFYLFNARYDLLESAGRFIKF